MSTLTQRPATEADRDTIFAILRESLRAYVEQVYGPWNDIEQRARFDEVTQVAHHSMLELDGRSIGFTCITRPAGEIYLNRIMILPEFQNRGFGTQILREVIERGDCDAVPVRLRVMKVNPAKRLYEREGFVVTGESDTHYMMERSPRRL